MDFVTLKIMMVCVSVFVRLLFCLLVSLIIVLLHASLFLLFVSVCLCLCELSGFLSVCV